MITSNTIKNITDVRVATICTTQVHSPGHAEAFSVVPFLPNRGLWDLKQDNCLSVTDGRWDPKIVELTRRIWDPGSDIWNQF